MLNVTNAARLFYPYEIEDEHQWLASKKEISKNVIAYEGLRKADDYKREDLKGVSPVAIGDGPKWTTGQPDISMFSLYSSAQVGIFGSIVRKTNVDKILQLDCNATDFYQEDSYPTYLYYNPYDTMKSVCFIPEGNMTVDLYDALTHQYLIRAIGGESCFNIEAKSSRLLVVLPAGSEVKVNDGKYTTNNKIVTYSEVNR
jgi:hypothetical protein